MKIIDTSADIPAVFDSGRFDLAKWESYMDTWIPGARELCLNDMRECIHAGFSWQNDFLPVLDSVLNNPSKRREAVRSFHTVTMHLDEKLMRAFHRTVDADLVLYLGLCNGAGWVATVNGKTTVLLGIEKIMELGWYEIDAMTGLIVHELGHVYQAQYGTLRIETDALPEQFLWQMFTEGVAMVFEQEVLGDAEHFHQYDSDWKSWCDQHAERIKRSFYDDMQTMTHENQRYFGDWVSFEGHGDVGYYLGARFVRDLLRFDSFDHIIQYGMGEVRKGYERFLQSARIHFE